jgi:hypothetical protein
MENEGLVRQLFVSKKFNRFLLIAWWCNIAFFLLSCAIAPFVNSTTSLGKSLFMALLVGCVPIALSALVLWSFMLAYLLIVGKPSGISKAIWALILIFGLHLGAYFYFGLVYRRAAQI